MTAAVFDPFRPRAPWWGGDLQTLRNKLRPPLTDFGSAREVLVKLPLADGSGDALVGIVQRPCEEPRSPLVLLIHGLGGSSESEYMRASAAFWLERGHPVLRLNLRGAGASRPLCRWQYHAGRTSDLCYALNALDPELCSAGLFLVGYSLGANMLLKFLAEHGASFPIRGGVSVSAPIDLAAAARRIAAPRNRFYQSYLLKGMKLEALASAAAVSQKEREAVLRARSVYEFDDLFVAPRNGYASADHYYADNMARRFLAQIRIPTLVIAALDDPWIPGASYSSYPWEGNPRLTPLLPRRGGHVGFHGRGSRLPWHDRSAARFLQMLNASG